MKSIPSFRKIPLGTRYAYGLVLVLITGLIMAGGSRSSSDDYMALWELVTVAAVTHWAITGIYVFWERRWYRFFALAVSALLTGSYIEMTLRVWKQS